MRRVFVTSDTHECHDKPFIYEPRGFKNVTDMNKTVVKNWNSVVQKDDEVYHLGDVMLNDNDEGLKLLRQLNGKIHIILGNHDSSSREKLYKECYNVVEVRDAVRRFEYNGFVFYMNHYPTFTDNFGSKDIHKRVIGLFGHTHQKEKFYVLKAGNKEIEIPYMYCVCLDAHNNTPVLLDDIIEDIKKRVPYWEKHKVEALV